MGKPLQIAIIDASNPPKGLVDAKKAADPKADTFTWGEVVGSYKVYACHDAQLDILASTAKFTFAFAGSGGGKTCLIPLWLLKRIRENPKGRFLVVSPTVSTFESSELKRHILDTFVDTAYGDAEGWKDGKKTYQLKTGGEIIVKTVGDGGDFQRLTGGQYDAAVADECYLLSAEVWEEIRRRVSNRNGQILAVTTPTGNNWIWEVKQRAETGDKDYYARHWSKTANPTVSVADVDREKTLMSAARYARMVEGTFAAYEGLIYDCFSDPTDKRFPVIDGDPFKALPSPPVRFFGGNDWGYKPDPASMLMIAECEDGVMYVVDEIYGTEITPDDLAKRARTMIDKWAIRVDSTYADYGGRFAGFYTDVSRPEQVSMFRRANVPIYNKGITDILAGIANTDKWFRAGRLKIFSNCVNLIRELRGYQWSKDRAGGLKDKPLGKNDHSCDALRYAISSHKKGQEPTAITQAVTDNAAERQKAERLGLITPKHEAALKEREAEREKRLFNRLALGDLFYD